MSLEIYYQDFMQDIKRVEDNFDSSIFTEMTCNFLVDQGDMSDFNYIGFKKTAKKIQVDAWDLDDTDTLNLVITDFRFSSYIEDLSHEKISEEFTKLKNFFSASLDKTFYSSIDETTPGYELARTIYEKSSEITNVKFFLISNACINEKDNIETFFEEETGQYHYFFHIWDINRRYLLESSGKSKEDIIIDFTQLSTNGISCLPINSKKFISYLLVMPGAFIAKMYGRYGERLIEQNIRTFLQFKGKVNKGIKRTLEKEPYMFFAYNNGLSATAEDVQIDESNNKIYSVTNLQIVNGGQTVASIYAAMKDKKKEFTDVFVQTKLTIVPPDEVMDVVPKISEYANTQNTIKAADFSSNHPFHLKIEEMSRHIWASSNKEGFDTHWFYERVRGQYNNAMLFLEPKARKDFAKVNPKNQLITKTDLAKYEHSLGDEPKPFTVSYGAQKNFSEFAKNVSKNWESIKDNIDENYFCSIVAKGIVFRFLDKEVRKQHWYGGYKANIVTYSLAKMKYTASTHGKNIDFIHIWRKQDLSDNFKLALLKIAELVNQSIQNTPENIKNVGEWCKRKECWKNVQEIDFTFDEKLIDELVDKKNNV